MRSMPDPGDGVEQLAWRLQHGELPVDRDRQPKVIIVHVGTNGASTCNCQIFAGAQWEVFGGAVARSGVIGDLLK